MQFFVLDKEHIKKVSEIEGEFYKYYLGKQIEITVINSDNLNNVLTKTALVLSQDRLMTKYTANNILYFDRDFIDHDTFNTKASCEVSVTDKRIRIGLPNKYSIKTGVLLFSGVLSTNNLVQEERTVYYSSALDWSKVCNKVSVIAAGVIRDKVYALYLIKNERGLAIGVRDTLDLGMSIKNLNVASRKGWSKFLIDDFFVENRVKPKKE